MRIALVNPTWSFENSIYVGCRSPHLPLELGACKVLLERAGHVVLMLDGAFDGLSLEGLAERVADFAPAMTVVTTAPTYLFWRCAQPELRVPRAFLDALGTRGGRTVAVGPHGSVTPETTLAKLACDIVVRGECEEVVVRLAEGGLDRPGSVPALAFRDGAETIVTGAPATTVFTDLPALSWPDAWISRHRHHHHRFDRAPEGPGAEVEASRGCPYSCTFCAKIDFRDAYRRRALPPLLEEIDRLIAQAVTYLYFIDEIFLPQAPLLEALAAREVEFGVQTRIDLWKPDMLDLLGAAGCVSIEAGVESLTEARRPVPFVQANLIKVAGDDPEMVAAWRDRPRAAGVWANDPVPLYPYPSSPDYRRLWGEPDGEAWERAHAHDLGQFDRFSDIQDERPAPLRELEAACCPA